MLESIGIINPWVYVVGALILVLLPGPNSLFVLKTSITHGKKEAFKALGAVLIGDAVLIFLSYIGIAAIIKANPILFTAVRYAGAAYLAYLGLQIIRSVFTKPTEAQKAAVEVPKKPSSFRTALILSLTNPKAILFYVSFFVQFIDTQYPNTWLSYTVLALILEAFSLVYFSLIINIAVAVVRFVGSRPNLSRFGNTAVGGLFLFFAGKLAAN